MRNIEIKAILKNRELVESRAKILSGSGPIVIRQSDTFFVVPRGRLKLRSFENGSGELIFYERPNNEGPKLSEYVKMELKETSACDGLKDILRKTNGIIGVVEKTRHLYLVGQSRIHIDQVKKLGHFVEIEVVLRDDENVKVGEEISKNLMEKLGISEEDLISTAYIDLLAQKK
ncbi:hypothetical protein HCN44_001478 [Aphidius gifuensis]|uniref:CYTH domain-containing protein n=1 Tax=Aphidius gifuensis TaxID=684658 RepID=A0A834XTF9_APHGI|nr:uncharacterized protein LOC122853349 [Aphidius gifuensis]KAF7992153.1 hypothetical protein HCN44_001478 [Aphidius gifuensis]